MYITTGICFATTVNADELGSLKQQVSTLQQEIEQTATAVESLMQPATSATKLGGYGELHLSNTTTKTNGVTTDKSKTIDFHRFVLFLNHEYTEDMRFYSELELEHSISGESQNGEVELEQAFMEFDINDRQSVKAGLFLLPVGIINETHEPPTFYGVERNPVEKNIIPATWWEGGVGLTGKLVSGWRYDLAMHSGLSTTTGDIRSGRQKVSEAPAENWAMTGRVKYNGIPGTELALAVQKQSDLAQGAAADKNDAILLETHAIWNGDKFGIKGLYAKWTIDGAAPALAGTDKQTGYYLEGTYKVLPKLGLFSRYSSWDNNAGNSADTKETQANTGLNWWPHEDVVIKFDIEQYEKDTIKRKGFNAGIGYQF